MFQAYVGLTAIEHNLSVITERFIVRINFSGKHRELGLSIKHPSTREVLISDLLDDWTEIGVCGRYDRYV